MTAATTVKPKPARCWCGADPGRAAWAMARAGICSARLEPR